MQHFRRAGHGCGLAMRARALFSLPLALAAVILACSSSDTAAVTTLSRGVLAASDSIAPVPGICAATFYSHHLPDDRKWYPVPVATSHAPTACPTHDAAALELYGWIYNGDDPTAPINGDCNGEDPDWHYELEVDTAWAASKGIDLNQLFRVGNLMSSVLSIKQSSDHLNMVGLPLIHMEIWGWRPSEHSGQAVPKGWVQVSPSSCPEVWWPFNPRNPLADPAPLQSGQYVRVFGSLVTDDSHDYTNQSFCGLLGTCDALTQARQVWNGGYANAVRGWPDEIDSKGRVASYDDPAAPARWTEIHPPDVIASLPDPGHHETLREIALFAPECLVGNCGVQVADEDIAPPAPCAGATPHIGFQELVGTAPGETTFGSLDQGNAAGPGGTSTGARIDVLADHIHVHIRTSGKSLNGGNGRFKALYRVFCTA